jgi:hypothetical protein
MKTLIVDIETSPNVAHVWQLFNQNVSLDQLQEPSFTLCWAAKWRGESKKVFANYHDPDFLQKIWNMMDEADAVVHYNGDKFDIPVLNKEFILAGMPPPSPYASIDLYKVVKKKFRFASLKMGHVAQQLGLSQKVAHSGHSLWVGVLQDDDKAWRMMKKYNLGDIVVTEELLERLLPWIDSFPNQNLYVDSDQPLCPTCGSTDLQRRGHSYTRLGRYQRFRCNGCTRWSRSSQRDEGTEVQVAL